MQVIKSDKIIYTNLLWLMLVDILVIALLFNIGQIIEVVIFELILVHIFLFYFLYTTYEIHLDTASEKVFIKNIFFTKEISLSQLDIVYISGEGSKIRHLLLDASSSSFIASMCMPRSFGRSVYMIQSSTYKIWGLFYTSVSKEKKYGYNFFRYPLVDRSLFGDWFEEYIKNESIGDKR